MTPTETLRHNVYYAIFQMGAPNLVAPEIVGLGLSKGLNDDLIEGVLSNVVDGPFGEVKLACDCAGIDGYVAALTETIAHIDNLPVSSGPDKAAVLADREWIKADVQARLASITAGEDQGEPEAEADPTDQLVEALERLFGVRLERIL